MLVPKAAYQQCCVIVCCRGNHGNIFGNSVGLELRKYRYFNSQTRGLDYQVGAEMQQFRR
jgi:aspartate/tyrosine/aromatic aminotransferase